jgi:hypothetical protein
MSIYTTQKEIMDAVGKLGEARFSVGFNNHEDVSLAKAFVKEAKELQNIFDTHYANTHFLMLVNAYHELQYLTGLTHHQNEKESQIYHAQSIATWDKIQKEAFTVLPAKVKTKEDERRHDSGGWNAFGTHYIGGSGCPYDWN